VVRLAGLLPAFAECHSRSKLEPNIEGAFRSRMADAPLDASNQTPDTPDQPSNADSITRAVSLTEAAFQHLAAALDAEARIFSELGGKVFYRGTPRQSRPVLRTAGLIGQLRDHIGYLHSKWKLDDLTGLGRLKVQDSEPNPVDPASRPQRFRKIQGMSVGKAAAMLGVKAVMVRSWLDSGMLKGHRPSGGNWRIPQIELVAFSKKFPSLVGRIK
jgi:excisionase family DNA binding protein